MKLAEVIYHDYNLVPVISRFNILLGFGDTTIENICKIKNINIDFFLTIINSFHDSKYSYNKHLQSFPLSVLIDYLQKTHKYYINNKLPDIKNLIKQMSKHGEVDSDSYMLLKKFFSEYITELIKHIEREENQIYPYFIKLENAINNKNGLSEILDEINNYTISNYYDYHENVEEKLTDLKNILIKYLPASTNAQPPQQYRYKLIKELFVLEKDLNDHEKIENLILIPKVKMMEQQIKHMTGINE